MNIPIYIYGMKYGFMDYKPFTECDAPAESYGHPIDNYCLTNDISRMATWTLHSRCLVLDD